MLSSSISQKFCCTQSVSESPELCCTHVQILTPDLIEMQHNAHSVDKVMGSGRHPEPITLSWSICCSRSSSPLSQPVTSNRDNSIDRVLFLPRLWRRDS